MPLLWGRKFWLIHPICGWGMALCFKYVNVEAWGWEWNNSGSLRVLSECLWIRAQLLSPPMFKFRGVVGCGGGCFAVASPPTAPTHDPTAQPRWRLFLTERKKSSSFEVRRVTWRYCINVDRFEKKKLWGRFKLPKIPLFPPIFIAVSRRPSFKSRRESGAGRKLQK